MQDATCKWLTSRPAGSLLDEGPALPVTGQREGGTMVAQGERVSGISTLHLRKSCNAGRRVLHNLQNVLVGFPHHVLHCIKLV